MQQSTMDILLQTPTHQWHHAWNRFGAVIERVESLSHQMSDAELLDEFDAFASTARTNCDSAAQMLLVCIAPIAAAHPQLAPSLLVRALEPLVFLGIESPDGVRAWLSNFLLSAEKYFGDSTASGHDWLTRIAAAPEPAVDAALASLLSSPTT